MIEQEFEADQLNERLDVAATEGIAKVDSEWFTREWWAVLAADALTQAPHPDFVRSLREKLVGQIDGPKRGGRPVRTVGIVAFPVYHPEAKQRQSAPSIAWSSFLTTSVAMVALLLAAVIVSPFWEDGEHHGAGVPTAQASSTSIVATATTTPAHQPMIATAIGFISGR